MASLAYVKEQRGMPFIKRGMEIEVDGHKGVVTSGNRSGNINVRLEGSKHPANCHPKWEAVYFDNNGTVVADYRTNKEELQ